MYLMLKRFAVLYLALGYISYANAVTIRIGLDEDYPPFSMPDETGKYIGFDVDIAKALCTQMKAQCEYVYINGDEILRALETEKVDAVIDTMTVTKERQARFDFTDMYINDPIRFVKRKSNETKFNVASFKGKTIGVQSGDDEVVAQSLFGKFATIKSYDNIKPLFDDFLDKKLDYIIGSASKVQFVFLNDNEKDFEFFGPNIAHSKTGVMAKGAAIVVKKGDRELVNQLNAALDSILNDGTYRKINDKYFQFNMHFN